MQKMVGKNNKFSKSNRNNRRFQRFSLRKLSIGVVSVAIAAGYYMGGSQSALADASSPQQAVPVVPGSLKPLPLRRRVQAVSLAQQR
ncbi:YSIRK-type signal peptide-containing protein [Limosilactobacillus pontis]|uniref:YSIRK-type signal peptide-containing protein n=1 Tax=Limosilactobacillus pontis TaxID=35787 RepID=A0ABU7SSA5_9LACO